MKIFKISNFLYKIISRNWFLLLGIILSSFFLTSTYVNYVVNSNVGYINYIKRQEFALLSLVISSSASIIFGLKLKDKNIEYLISNRFNYFISALIASIKLGAVICLIPLSYILMYIFSHQSMSTNYILNGLFEFIFTYFVCLICSSMITTIICFFFDNTIIRIVISTVMILITSSFKGIFLAQNKISMILANTLNIHEDFEYSIADKFLGFNHDIRYIFDKLIVFSILSIILFIIAIKFYKKSKYINFIKRSIILLVLLTIAFFSILYNSFILIEENESFAYENKVQQDILIEEYKMNLDFGYKLKNEVNIKIKNNSENKINTISLILDDIFKINTIKVNGEKLKFIHENDKININLNKELDKNNRINLEINYRGRVNHINNIGYQQLIVNSNKILLPIDSLAWYPLVNQDKDIKFDLNLNSNLDIKSNLNLNEKENTLNGISKSVFLAAGYSQTINIDGYEINFPEDTNIIELNNLLNYLKKYIESLNLSEIEKTKIFDKKRIIFAPINNVTNLIIQIVDGTIIFTT